MILLKAALNRLFANKLVVDDRIPLTLFHNVLGYRLAVLPLEITLHVQLVVLILAQIASSIILSVITWYGVVRPVKESKAKPPVSAL